MKEQHKQPQPSTGGAPRAQPARAPAGWRTRPRIVALLACGALAVSAAWLTRERWRPALRSLVSPGETARMASGPSFDPLPLPLTKPTPSRAEAPPPVSQTAPQSRPLPVAREIASGLQDVHDLAFSPDERFIITAGYGDNSVRVFDLAGAGEVQGIRTHRRPTAIVVEPGTGRVLVADVYGFLRVHLWRAGRLSWSRIHAREGTLGREIAISPDGGLLATTPWESTERSDLVLLATRDFSVLRRTGVQEALRRPAFSPSGRHLAAGSAGNSFMVWDLSTGLGTRYQVPRVDPKSDVGSVAFSPDDRLLATGHMDSSITVWDLERGRLLHNFYVPQAATWCVAFDPTGGVLATAQADGTIHLWDPGTARSLGVLRGHKGGVTDIRFDRSGSRMASVSEDDRLLVWERPVSAAAPAAAAPPAASAPATSPEQMTTADILPLLAKVRGMESIPQAQRKALGEAADRLDTMSEEQRVAFVAALVLIASTDELQAALQHAMFSWDPGGPAVEDSDQESLAWNLGYLPEAEPLASGLRALDADDVRRFREIFSRRAAQGYESDWEGAFRFYQSRWREALHGAGLRQIHVGFLGSADTGTLLIPEPVHPLPREAVEGSVPFAEVPVVLEEGRWKIDLSAP